MSSRDAVAHGICPGMPLAEAQALFESARFFLHDSEADIRELKTLAGFADHYSPVAGLEL